MSLNVPSILYEGLSGDGDGEVSKIGTHTDEGRCLLLSDSFL